MPPKLASPGADRKGGAPTEVHVVEGQLYFICDFFHTCQNLCIPKWLVCFVVAVPRYTLLGENGAPERNTMELLRYLFIILIIYLSLFFGR